LVCVPIFHSVDFTWTYPEGMRNEIDMLNKRLKDIESELEIEQDWKRLQDLFSEQKSIEDRIRDLVFKDF